MKIKINLEGREIEQKPAVNSIRQGTAAKIMKSQRVKGGTLCQTGEV